VAVAAPWSAGDITQTWASVRECFLSVATSGASSARPPSPRPSGACRSCGRGRIRAFRTFLILGTSSGAPNWHQPRQSSPSNTRAACAVPARTRASFRSRLGGTVPLLSSWNPMHQQPPKTPLLRSTNAANAGQVDSSNALTVYSGTTADRNRFGARPPRARTLSSYGVLACASVRECPPRTRGDGD
jgi:hypothetical protein